PGAAPASSASAARWATISSVGGPRSPEPPCSTASPCTSCSSRRSGPSELTLVEAFAAWALVRILGSIPLTPGGIGVVELGLTGALVGFGGANAEVVAAVLLYRLLTTAPTLLVGLVAAGTFRRQRRPRPDTAAP